MNSDRNSDGLRPCPFCGSANVYPWESENKESTWYVECKKCGVIVLAPNSHTTVEEWWNRRTEA